MAKAYPLERIEQLKIRERIRDLVLYRIEVINPHKEALRRALAILAQPQNAMAGAKLAWRAAEGGEREAQKGKPPEHPHSIACCD